MILSKCNKAIPLGEIQVGLFLHGDTLVFKTEYSTNSGLPECYIVESGEFFIANTKTPEELNALMVNPVEIISNQK